MTDEYNCDKCGEGFLPEELEILNFQGTYTGREDIVCSDCLIKIVNQKKRAENEDKIMSVLMEREKL